LRNPTEPTEQPTNEPEESELIRVRREKASEPEGNLGGKVWLDDVSLVPLAPVAATAASRAGGRS